MAVVAAVQGILTLDGDQQQQQHGKVDFGLVEILVQVFRGIQSRDLVFEVYIHVVGCDAYPETLIEAGL